jgi:aspartyl-tRNA(Asn)/glutamyl-tRNA(Gln) amidotransferase subunit A
MTSAPPGNVLDLVRDLAAGTVSAAETVAERLRVIGDRDAEISAFVALDADAAQAEAEHRDALRRRGGPLGPLHGVPVAIKDLIDVAGQVTTAGSRLPAGPPAPVDALVVQRIRAAGAVVLGRARTHEFAWGMTTQHESLGGTRNPVDPTRVPGGSSGGSAAAVAAGFVPLAVGTDTAGSLRLPAAWCGVVAHKPSSGLVPAVGVVPLAASLDQVGGLGTDVAGTRLLLEVLSGQRLSASPESFGRIGILRFGSMEPTAAEAVRRGVAALERAGMAVEECELPELDGAVDTLAAIQAHEALGWHRVTGRWPIYRDLYGTDVRGRFELAEGIEVEALERAQDHRTRLGRATERLFAGYDAVLAPVAGAAPSFVDSPDEVEPTPGRRVPLRSVVLPYTVWASLGGLPVTAVPVGRLDGLPLGLQVVGAHGSDHRVLDLADLIMRLGPHE